MALTSESLRQLPRGLDKPDWNNLNVISRNTLPPRAHFYPYDDETSALSYNVHESPNVANLSGIWKFHFARKPTDAPGLTNDTSSWNDIPVPSMWQFHGYHIPQYLNIRYPFQENVPEMQAEENHVGTYQRKFTVPEKLRNQQVRLRFEGVESAFHVWVNGREVGYHQGSRNPVEWNVTDFLNLSGENVVTARVYRWCFGSYIEDQDMWRLNGIFREVILVGFPKDCYIQDYSLRPDLDGTYTNGILTANITAYGTGKLSLKLLDENLEEIAQAEEKASERTQFRLEIPSPKKWTAETPNLYHVVISFNGKTTVAQRVGFKKVELKGKDLLVNGKRIIFLGVNRHEHYTLSGRTVPYELMRHDLITMKKHNINAIRTSHYPDHPSFYNVADELGFYVINEADYESHGLDSKRGWKRPKDWVDGPWETTDADKWLADNPAWTDILVDRARQMVVRDRNHASVTMWSLGNEAQIGRNHLYMADWIRSNDPTRPVHYERDEKRHAVDVFSRMYLGHESIFEQLPKMDRVLILCEYAHAMGNGPGGLKDYVDLFRNTPGIQGGFVWEYNNHGLLTKTKEGTPYYAYGGDFGDNPNDGNFVLDGLCFSDHTPTPGLTEYKQAIAPVSFGIKNGTAEVDIVNHNFFITTEYLDFSWTLSKEGMVIQEGDLEVPGIGPQSSARIEIPIETDDLSKEEHHLAVTARLSKDSKWATAGHEVSFGQGLYIASDSAFRQDLAHGKIGLKKSGKFLEISSSSSNFTFDTESSGITWMGGGKELVKSGPRLGYYRAPTDNDAARYRGSWQDAGLDRLETKISEVFWSTTAETVVVEAKVSVICSSKTTGLNFENHITYTFRDSSLQLHVKGTPKGSRSLESLARIGLTFVLPPGFEQVEWYGRGPGENYPDSNTATGVGQWKKSVDEMHTPYEYPQENGNRMDTRWVSVRGAGGSGIRASFGEPFHFSTLHYTESDLERSRHPHELTKLKETVLRLDYRHLGLGSNSVGPAPREPYRVPLQPYEFTVTLKQE